MERRSFFYRVLTLIAGLILAAIPYGLARLLMPGKLPLLTTKKALLLHDLLRPPGALADDTAFNKACINCNLCGQVCPPQCINYYPSDGNNANTPYIDPSIKACILCGQCMEVCPTDALTVVDTNEIFMGRARIERRSCFPWVDQGICGACVSICPLGEKAIDFEFANIYRPFVKEGCIGCGLCVEVCPHPSLPIRVLKYEETELSIG